MDCATDYSESQSQLEDGDGDAGSVRASSVSARDLKRCAKRFGKLAHASKSRTIQLTLEVVDARTLRRIH